MAELRKSYLLDEWVLIAAERQKRPLDFRAKGTGKKLPRLDRKCFFCPGNEHTTPPEISRIGGKKWNVRGFPNKFAAVSQTTAKVESPLFFHKLPAIGRHEVIVESPRHDLSLKGLTVNEHVLVLQAYKDRFNALSKEKGTKEVNIFKNYGEGSGASLANIDFL